MPPKPLKPPVGKSTNVRQKVAKSLREVYEDSCRDHQVHPNSNIVKMLPEKHGQQLSMDTLDLRANYVGDKGVGPLVHIVLRCPTVRSLILTDNGLRNHGVQTIASLVGKHPGLTAIDLSDNYISEGAAVALDSLLRENPRIVELGINNTKIDVDYRIKLKGLLALNKTRSAAL